MRWKFWKKNDDSDKYKSVVETLPAAALFRWYCYDLGIENIKELSVKLGMTPISDEAEKSEMTDSFKRTLQIKYLIPFLDLMAQINMRVMVEENRDLTETMPLSSEQKERIEKLLMQNFYMISFSALLTAFSSAMELGLVESGPVIAAGIGDLNE